MRLSQAFTLERDVAKIPATWKVMAQGSQESKAQLKRDLDQLGKDLYNIDLQLQRKRKSQQQGHIPTLEQAKLDI